MYGMVAMTSTTLMLGENCSDKQIWWTKNSTVVSEKNYFQEFDILQIQKKIVL